MLNFLCIFNMAKPHNVEKLFVSETSVEAKWTSSLCKDFDNKKLQEKDNDKRR